MRSDWREISVVFVGGAAGALARVAIEEAWPAASDAFPWAVFAINITGAALLAWIVSQLTAGGSVTGLRGPLARRMRDRLGIASYRRQLMGTGFCGAYTTFSTVQLDLLHLVEAHRYDLAVLCLVASVVAGYAAVYMATALSRAMRVRT